MSSYAEAGIRQYRIEPVLDEQTTNICRYLHGKTFSVADALRRFDRIEQLEDPEAIKQAMPWVREAQDRETRPHPALRGRRRWSDRPRRGHGLCPCGGRRMPDTKPREPETTAPTTGDDHRGRLRPRPGGPGTRRRSRTRPSSGRAT
jgi:hypothetical protein